MTFQTPLIPIPILIATALLLGATGPASAQGSGRCISVEVQNVRPQQGYLMVAAYGDGESFNKKVMTQARVPAGDATTRFELCGVSGDTVALSMYQDLDSDGKLGRNALGLPTEPWGSSGKPGLYGPTWETGKVKLDGQPIVVRLTS